MIRNGLKFQPKDGYSKTIFSRWCLVVLLSLSFGLVACSKFKPIDFNNNDTSPSEQGTPETTPPTVEAAKSISDGLDLRPAFSQEQPNLRKLEILEFESPKGNADLEAREMSFSVTVVYSDKKDRVTIKGEIERHPENGLWMAKMFDVDKADKGESDLSGIGVCIDQDTCKTFFVDIYYMVKGEVKFKQFETPSEPAEEPEDVEIVVEHIPYDENMPNVENIDHGDEEPEIPSVGGIRNGITPSTDILLGIRNYDVEAREDASGDARTEGQADIPPPPGEGDRDEQPGADQARTAVQPEIEIVDTDAIPMETDIDRGEPQETRELPPAVDNDEIEERDPRLQATEEDTPIDRDSNIGELVEDLEATRLAQIEAERARLAQIEAEQARLAALEAENAQPTETESDAEREARLAAEEAARQTENEPEIEDSTEAKPLAEVDTEEETSCGLLDFGCWFGSGSEDETPEDVVDGTPAETTEEIVTTEDDLERTGGEEVVTDGTGSETLTVDTTPPVIEQPAELVAPEIDTETNSGVVARTETDPVITRTEPPKLQQPAEAETVPEIDTTPIPQTTPKPRPEGLRETETADTGPVIETEQGNPDRGIIAETEPVVTDPVQIAQEVVQGSLDFLKPIINVDEYLNEVDPTKDSPYDVDLRGFGWAQGKHAGGSLHQGLALPFEGEGYSISEFKRDRHRNYGTGMMVNMIIATASIILERYQDNHLHVSDISAQSGGKIGSHSSHQNGLDADISYLGMGNFESTLTACKGRDGRRLDSCSSRQIRSEGKRCQARDGTWYYCRYSIKDGTATNKFKEQIPKNFDYFRLLTASGMVKWIGMNKGVKRAFCQWAKDEGTLEDPETVAVLSRMTEWTGHHSHFHLRLFCPPRNAGAHPLCVTINPRSVIPMDQHGCGHLL